MAEYLDYAGLARFKQKCDEAYAGSSGSVTKADLNKLAKLHGYNTIDDVPNNQWEGIQQKIRAGTIQTDYHLGDEISVARGNQTLIFEVASFDTATLADSNYTHSMTLVAKYLYWQLQFDAPEPTNPDSNRARYGSNNYRDSAIRQWLNSDKAAGQWWTAQTQYDVAPSYASTEAGFLNGLDADFVSVLGNVNLVTANNTVTDGGGSYTLTDKVFLLSETEAGLGNENSIAEGTATGLYTSNNRRIKKLNNSSGNTAYWWLRTPDASSSGVVRSVYTVGTLYGGGGAYNSYGVAPACVIY